MTAARHRPARACVLGLAGSLLVGCAAVRPAGEVDTPVPVSTSTDASASAAADEGGPDGAPAATPDAGEAAGEADGEAGAPGAGTGDAVGDGGGSGGGAAASAAGDDDVPAAALEALWWTAETVDGGTLAAADLAGTDVVLWMWAPWCSVCNAEAPDVARALADLPDDVTLIGVAGRDDVGPMRAFVTEHGLQDMTHVVDEDGSLWASYGVAYQPAWVFIDAEGSTAVAAGAIGYDGLFSALDEVFGS